MEDAYQCEILSKCKTPGCELERHRFLYIDQNTLGESLIHVQVFS